MPGTSATIGAGALRQDGNLLGADRAVSFTTQTAATITDFQVHLVPRNDSRADAARGGDAPIPYGAADFMLLGNAPLIDTPEDTLAGASSETGIRISFATPMDRKDVSLASQSLRR